METTVSHDNSRNCHWPLNRMINTPVPTGMGASRLRLRHGRLDDPIMLHIHDGRADERDTAKKIELEIENVVFSTRRLIVRQFSDAVVQEDMKNGSFDAVMASGMSLIRPRPMVIRSGSRRRSRRLFRRRCGKWWRRSWGGALCHRTRCVIQRLAAAYDE